MLHSNDKGFDEASHTIRVMIAEKVQEHDLCERCFVTQLIEVSLKTLVHDMLMRKSDERNAGMPLGDEFDYSTDDIRAAIMQVIASASIETMKYFTSESDDVSEVRLS